MRLCFDATRFGCGLDGAVALAASKGLKSFEYSFQPFAAGSKAEPALDKKETVYLDDVRKQAERNGIKIECLNLDYCLDADDKKSIKNFIKMASKLVLVASVVGCPRLAFSVLPGPDNKWKEGVEEALSSTAALSGNRDVRFLLRLSTPSQYRGQSLKKWRAMEPQDWRDLISSCPDLSLSFSPADCVWLGIDYLQILSGLIQAIDHVEALDMEINRPLLQDSGMFGPLWWRYRTPGKGQVDWRQLIEALKLYDFNGSFSIHLDDEFTGKEPEDLNDELDNCIKSLGPFVRD